LGAVVNEGLENFETGGTIDLRQTKDGKAEPG
jgi:hypothetical protein